MISAKTQGKYLHVPVVGVVTPHAGPICGLQGADPGRGGASAKHGGYRALSVPLSVRGYSDAVEMHLKYVAASCLPNIKHSNL